MSMQSKSPIGIYRYERKGNTMEKNLTPKLKSYKEEFDFIHKKIGELEWEIATIFYGRKGIKTSEIEMLRDQLENYRDNIGMLVEKIKSEVTEANKSK